MFLLLKIILKKLVGFRFAKLVFIENKIFLIFSYFQGFFCPQVQTIFMIILLSIRPNNLSLYVYEFYRFVYTYYIPIMKTSVFLYKKKELLKYIFSNKLENFAI